jgi:uncharacterized protein YbaR (Trm112 family)
MSLLVCPQNHMPLSPAEGALLAKLNRAISAGGVKNSGGRPVEGPWRGGLVRKDRLVVYPIVDDIPILLPEEAIALDSIDKTAGK